ncbi:amino acid ABC transporter permease [Paenarthrobacter sp. NPDC089989]|uniref:amino acid ABC transporter permease n=1 Tax=unclassified Paenarthrobacter TaxID=2634190 RepID=UPI00381C5824
MNEYLRWLQVIGTGLGTTFILTVASFVIGGVLAFPLAMARVAKNPLPRLLSSGFIAVARGIPPIAWLFVIFFGLGQLGLKLNSLTAAIFGLSVISAGYLAEIYRSGLLAVPAGQREASSALGLASSVTLRKIIIPQAVVTVVPIAVAFFIGLLKDSAIASVIGVQEVTAFALALSRREADSFGVFLAAGALYLIISIPIAVFGRWLGPWTARRVGVAA